MPPWFAAKQPGDAVRVKVRRGDATLEKTATFPGAKPEPAFERGATWGAMLGGSRDLD